jgi:hypothetical protein
MGLRTSIGRAVEFKIRSQFGMRHPQRIPSTLRLAVEMVAAKNVSRYWSETPSMPHLNLLFGIIAVVGFNLHLTLGQSDSGAPLAETSVCMPTKIASGPSDCERSST